MHKIKSYDVDSNLLNWFSSYLQDRHQSINKQELDECSKKWLMSFSPDKTEIMLFSNTDIPEFNFTFNGTTIPITNYHKPLGVTFSSDSKWNIHIENILFSIYKHLNVLRKLKYKFLVKI